MRAYDFSDCSVNSNSAGVAVSCHIIINLKEKVLSFYSYIAKFKVALNNIL